MPHSRLPIRSKRLPPGPTARGYAMQCPMSYPNAQMFSHATLPFAGITLSLVGII